MLLQPEKSWPFANSNAASDSPTPGSGAASIREGGPTETRAGRLRRVQLTLQNLDIARNAVVPNRDFELPFLLADRELDRTLLPLGISVFDRLLQGPYDQRLQFAGLAQA